MAAITRRRPEPAFRPDVEGLRAVAVLAVIAFHTGVVRGGFVGVDVFFVISGFLITGLLWAELRSTGRLNLARFYAARARRLLPAAAVVLIVTAAAAAALLPPLQARSVLDDGLASALYVGNYRFAITGTDYLGHAAPSPFQHYWSLGVEEQFYLVWPALLLGIALVCGGRRIGLLVALVLLAAGSFVLSLHWTHTAPPWAFFSLPTRAWELAAGGFIALSVPAWRRLPPGVAAIAGVGGAALIAAAVIGLDGDTAYPGSAALMPVLGTALLIGAGCRAPGRGAGRLLCLPVMRAIGRLSYSWYLWHWPLLVLAPAALGHPALGNPALGNPALGNPTLGNPTGGPPLGWAGLAATVAASFVLAVLTLRFLERPLRYSRPLRVSTGRSLMLGSAVTAAAVAAAMLLPMLVPAPGGRDVPTAAALAHPSHPFPSPSAVPSARDPLTGAVALAQAAVEDAAGGGPVPADLSPSLTEAARDKPEVFLDGCVRSWVEIGVPDCVSGEPTAATTVALIGDSHAAMWEPAMDLVARQRNWRLVTIAKVTCPVQDLPINSPYLGREYSECEQWRREALAALVGWQPELVVLSMSRRYGADFGFTSYDPAWMASLTDLVAELRASTGARVLVLGPVPDPLSDVPVCLSANIEDTLACAPPRREALNTDGITAEMVATGAGGGQYAELSEMFCTTQVCPVVVGSDLVFRDDNHLTVSYARALAPVMDVVAEQAMAPHS